MENLTKSRGDTAYTPDAAAPLERKFGLLSATALNMTNMMGAGPFITIPLLMTALGGPQAMLGWLVALIIVICDGMIWSELGAAMPQSGGSFGYAQAPQAESTAESRPIPGNEPMLLRGILVGWTLFGLASGIGLAVGWLIWG